MSTIEGAVYVSNISPSATEKTVSDFFSFCGKITKLTLLRTQEGEPQEAIVVFQADSAAKTALLLTNALIVDRPIVVVPYVPSEQPPVGTPQEVPAENITNRPFPVPDSERSKTSVIASMLAAGYELGTDAANKAREIDEKHSISQQLKVGADQVKAKANEIDKALHISETASVIKAVTVEKAKEVDEKLHLTEKVGQAADAVKQQANALATKASENEIVAKGVGIVKNIGSSIQQQFQNLKDETNAIVEQKRAQEQGQKPAAVAAAAAAPPAPVSAETTATVSTPDAPSPL